MGADYQEMNVGMGRTFDDAFNQVREEAAYLYGHDGYSGTMAEKESAIFCGQLPPRMNMDKFSTLQSRYNEFNEGVWIGNLFEGYCSS